MGITKYSRQRQAILDFLKTREDHPTADIIYYHLRKDYPNISLGTVYRNLGQLAAQGEISKLSYGDGADHFDYASSDHIHVICQSCGKIADVYTPAQDVFAKEVASQYDGEIERQQLFFFGTCSVCQRKGNSPQKSSK